MAILTNIDVRNHGHRIEYTITLVASYDEMPFEIPFGQGIIGKNVRLVEVTDEQQFTLFGDPIIPLQNHNKLSHIQEGIHAIDKLLDDKPVKREVKNSISELEL